MKVKDCMCDKVNCVKPETSVQDCAKIYRTDLNGEITIIVNLKGNYKIETMK